jgi:hypothetical protein
MEAALLPDQTEDSGALLPSNPNVNAQINLVARAGQLKSMYDDDEDSKYVCTD